MSVLCSKTCPSCGCNFDIPKGKQGGKNRIYCYTCLPLGLSAKERKYLNQKLLSKEQELYKLSRGCDICGYNRCVKALEWHHIKADSKLGDPSEMRYSRKKYLTEIAKCALLCANCHREVEAGISQLNGEVAQSVRALA